MECLDRSLEKGVGHPSNDQANERHYIGDDNPSHLRVVATYRPRQIEERQHADEPADKGHRLIRRLERGEDHESTKQTEKNRPVPHEYFEIRLIELKTVEHRQPLAPQNATQREQVNDTHDNQHR